MRVCSVHGCPEIYDDTNTRCPKHRRAADQARGDRGYSSTGHRRFRAAVLQREPICVICGVAQATIADHYPMSRRELIDAGLDSNDPARGRGLCKPCHDHATSQNQPGGFNRH